LSCRHLCLVTRPALAAARQSSPTVAPVLITSRTTSPGTTPRKTCRRPTTLTGEGASHRYALTRRRTTTGATTWVARAARGAAATNRQPPLQGATGSRSRKAAGHRRCGRPVVVLPGVSPRRHGLNHASSPTEYNAWWSGTRGWCIRLAGHGRRGRRSGPPTVLPCPQRQREGRQLRSAVRCAVDTSPIRRPPAAPPRKGSEEQAG
jgi:hypothetical protein